MNGFFRTAAFPLIVIVLLVYLASQTLIRSGEHTAKLAYSELVRRVERNPSTVSRVVFKPNRHQVRAELANGNALEASYPTPESQRDFERSLRANDVTFDFDWKGPSSSPWLTMLTSLLPFFLLFGFWIFLMNQRPPRRVRLPQGLKRRRSADLQR